MLEGVNESRWTAVPPSSAFSHSCCWTVGHGRGVSVCHYTQRCALGTPGSVLLGSSVAWPDLGAVLCVTEPPRPTAQSAVTSLWAPAVRRPVGQPHRWTWVQLPGIAGGGRAGEETAVWPWILFPCVSATKNREEVKLDERVVSSEERAQAPWLWPPGCGLLAWPLGMACRVQGVQSWEKKPGGCGDLWWPVHFADCSLAPAVASFLCVTD